MLTILNHIQIKAFTYTPPRCPRLSDSPLWGESTSPGDTMRGLERAESRRANLSLFILSHSATFTPWPFKKGSGRRGVRKALAALVPEDAAWATLIPTSSSR